MNFLEGNLSGEVEFSSGQKIIANLKIEKLLMNID